MKVGDEVVFLWTWTVLVYRNTQKKELGQHSVKMAEHSAQDHMCCNLRNTGIHEDTK